MLKKVAMFLSAAAIVNFSSEPIKALANEIQSANVALISAENVNLEKAEVTLFDLYGKSELAEYDKIYKMDSSNIKSISSNGGTYGGNYSFGNAIDGKLDTFWHTGKQNSATFTNEVNVELTENTTLNRIVYAARQDSAKGKGFPEQFEIYGSTTESGNDFKLVTIGGHITTGNLVEIEFKPTDFKRIKFVFKKANQEWASASEFWFYKEDPLTNKIKDLFTNGAMAELKPQYNTKTVVDSLNKELESHPLKSIYSEHIKIANELIVDKDKYKDRIMTLSQRGNENTEKARTKTSFAMFAFDPTGYYVTPGETIKVYVDAKDGDIMPTLVFGQGSADKSGWRREFALKPGLNVITAQTQDKMNPAGIYFANRALKSEQAYAPKIRIEGGTKYPLYVHGKTDPVAFISELEEYLKKVSYKEEDFANGNPNGYHYNMTELSSENNVITTTATGAYKGLSDQYKKLGKTPADTMNAWEVFYDDFAKFSGYDLTDETSENYRPRGKFMSRVFVGGPYGWADHGYTGYNGDNNEKRDAGLYNQMVQEYMVTKADWLIAHEWGHMVDNTLIATHESTNNLYSLYMEDKYLEENRMVRENRWAQFETYHNNKQYPNDVFFLLGISYQVLSVYGDEMYGEAQRITRLNEGNWTSGLNNKERHAIALSKAIGKDITAHYEYFTIPISEKAKALVANLPKETKKTYYVNNKYMEKDAAAFKDPNVKPEIKTTKINHGNVQLDFTINEDDNALLLYEIYRDGKYLGVTYSNSFLDKTAEAGKTHEYSVIAYDRKLNPSKEGGSSVENIVETIIKTSDAIVDIKDKFDVMDGVTATGGANEDITSNIKIKSSNFVSGESGQYTVVYTVTDKNGKTVEKTRIITVKDRTDFLSDLNWKSATTGWGTIKKDKSIDGNPIRLLSEDGKVVEYEKGIGTHSNSTIIYDIKSEGYKAFEAYVGVDQEMVNRSSASIIFEVYVDGEKVFDSGVVNWKVPQKYVNIPLNNASELKLVTRHEGKNADHTDWANAKLHYVENKGDTPVKVIAPPVIETSNITVSSKDKFDVLSGVTATDKSKADITSSIKVKSSDYIEGKSGVYTVVYTVTDKNGITVYKTRTITVKDGTDFLSDLNWKSATTGWGTIKKDKSIDGNPIRLLSEEGKVVEYEKGIGTHSNSTIIYDIKGKNYKAFEAYVGVDQEMVNRSSASIIFEVYVDGEKVFDSGIVSWKVPQKHVNIPLNNASELKLVARHEGIRADHTDWANASLHYVNGEGESPTEATASPIIETIDITVSVEDKFDALSGVTATDESNEDITSSIKVKSSDYVEGKVGEYTVVYTVTDKNGITVDKTRTITVKDGIDFLSDLNWKSAVSGWGTVQKDKSIEGNPIRLLLEDGQVAKYEKGIGTHANSTIIYDIKGKGYKTFEAEVGVEQKMAGRADSSIIFEVYVDGEKKFDSGLMKADTLLKRVNVDLNNASELKLVVKDGGNNIHSDHGNWANASLNYVSYDKENYEIEHLKN